MPATGVLTTLPLGDLTTTTGNAIFDVGVQEMLEKYSETDEFRDFVVWLCGFTEYQDPPGKQDWERLRTKTKHIAAQFALRARENVK